MNKQKSSSKQTDTEKPSVTSNNMSRAPNLNKEVESR